MQKKITKNNAKYIASLQKKKNRFLHKQFVVEGKKMVDEVLQSELKVARLVVSPEYINRYIEKQHDIELFEAGSKEFGKMSHFKTPQQILAVVDMPEYTLDYRGLDRTLSLFLDRLNDPGNLGTILRIADWFGIERIICTDDTVDVFNPKCLQATMGSIFRVQTHYVDSIDFFSNISEIPVYGLYLNGKSIYKCELSQTGIIVMGSESHGISEPVSAYIKERLFIPPFSDRKKISESLNVSMATAIVCSEFRRRS